MSVILSKAKTVFIVKFYQFLAIQQKDALTKGQSIYLKKYAAFSLSRFLA